MRWVAVVLVVVITATPVLASAQPVEQAEQVEVMERNWSLKTLLANAVWATLLFFGHAITWALYGDAIVEGVRSGISLAREKWDRYIAVLFVKTGRVCRLAQASDGEWVALCED